MSAHARPTPGFFTSTGARPGDWPKPYRGRDACTSEETQIPRCFARRSSGRSAGARSGGRSGPNKRAARLTDGALLARLPHSLGTKATGVRCIPARFQEWACAALRASTSSSRRRSGARHGRACHKAWRRVGTMTCSTGPGQRWLCGSRAPDSQEQETGARGRLAGPDWVARGQPADTAWLSLCLMSSSSILLNSSGGILWIRCSAASSPSP